jgi:hypothetical protein
VRRGAVKGDVDDEVIGKGAFGRLLEVSGRLLPRWRLAAGAASGLVTDSAEASSVASESESVTQR